MRSTSFSVEGKGNKVSVRFVFPKVGKFSRAEISQIEILALAHPTENFKLEFDEGNRAWKAIADPALFQKITIVGGPVDQSLSLDAPLIYQFRYGASDGSQVLSEPGIWHPPSGLRETGKTFASFETISKLQTEGGIAKSTFLSRKQRAVYLVSDDLNEIVRRVALDGLKETSRSKQSDGQVFWIGESQSGIVTLARGTNVIGRVLDPTTLASKGRFELPIFDCQSASSFGSQFLFTSFRDPDSRRPAIGVTDLENGKQHPFDLETLLSEGVANGGLTEEEAGRFDKIMEIALTPDGKWLYARRDKSLLIFRILRGRPVLLDATLAQSRGAGLVFSEDGQMIAMRSHDWTVFATGTVDPPLASVASGESFFGFCPASSSLLCWGNGSPGFFTPGGDRMAVINRDTLSIRGHSAHMWTLEGGRFLLVSNSRELTLLEVNFPVSK